MKKRWFRLGPWTTLAVTGAVVVAYVRFPGWQREAEDARQLQEARAQITRTGRAKAPLTRTLDTLWSERASLHLSDSQLHTLTDLRAQEARDTAPLKQNAAFAERAFDQWMKAHEHGSSVSQIEQHASLYISATVPLTLERQRCWNRALRLLTRAQRNQIELKTQSQP